MKSKNFDSEVYLSSNGEFWISYPVEGTIKFEQISYFSSPKQILIDYIDSLIEASERNKEQLKELEIFRRVIEALTETTIPEYHKEKKLEA